ncbi:hypothetical protein CYMTET_38937 [Cymbomonas tetramitiformis]|uniref:Uncharacterized protein n=1 Tax=Cymbomonas tetramitiformis TaxID=36881 RepID=A0AAE0CB21_9CHLO|nr:hypothetical protein CYMTET_38937 [Cymbomonas tetramitiformis]|eukprot:gene22539-27202_t
MCITPRPMCQSNKEEGPTLVYLQPAKALEFSEGCAVRVTPQSSLHSVLNGQEDAYDLHHFASASFAVKKSCNAVYVTRTTITVVVGKLDNAEHLKRKHGLDPLCTDAEIIHFLNNTFRFNFLPSLRGKFSLIVYNQNADQVFAATDTACSFDLLQGQDSTGGLLVTDYNLGPNYQLSTIPGASFIFGKYRGRNIHKYASTETELVATAREAHAAAERALEGSGVSSSAYPDKLNLRSFTSTTFSAKGTADKARSWRRVESTCYDMCKSPESPLCVGSVFDMPYSTKASEKYSGRADSSSSWRIKA